MLCSDTYRIHTVIIWIALSAEGRRCNDNIHFQSTVVLVLVLFVFLICC